MATTTTNNTAVQIFTNEQFGNVRMIAINGEPYAVGKDVAEILGYAKARNAIAAHVDDEDKKVAPIQGPLGGTQEMTVINESGIYSLILSSQMPKAKEFKRWVTSEILPTIRRHGAYIAPVTLENIIADPAFGIRLLTALQEERAGRVAAEAKVAEHEETINNLAPYAEHGIRCMSSPNSITVGELANRLNQNGYRTGQNRLFQDLVSRGYLYRRGKEYRAYQRYLATDTNAGLFDYTYVTFPVGDDPNGGSYIQVKVTSHGQKYFERLYTPSDDTEE